VLGRLRCAHQETHMELGANAAGFPLAHMSAGSGQMDQLRKLSEGLVEDQQLQ
jgi:hypothetical protein